MNSKKKVSHRRSVRYLTETSEDSMSSPQEQQTETNNNQFNLNGSIRDRSFYDIEIGWFMKEEFPKVCRTLRETLKDITEFIVKPTEGKKDDLDDYDGETKVSFKATNDLLSGYLVLAGWNITTAEIQGQFNTQGKPPFKTHIQKNPLKLEQIQSIYYYCNEALEQFDDILSAYSPEEIDLDISNKILDVVLNKLRSAKDQLLKPNNVSFESNLQNKKIFKPPLPNDVIVELKVKNSTIIIISALIQPTNNNNNLKHKSTPKMSRSLTSSNSKSFFSRKHNQFFEILEQNSVECKPKKLDSLCTLIQNAYSIALSCKEKNIVLQSLIY